MNPDSINYLAVFVAALSTFLIGGLWYSPILFGNAWMKANGFSEEEAQNTNMAKVFGFSFLFSLLMAFNLAMFLAEEGTTTTWGAMAGFLAGFGWVALGIGIIALFEKRSWTYILINGGYMTVAFTVMGLILGAWR